MDFSRHTDLLEGVVNQLIDEEALGVCLEMHRAIKLGYYELIYPEDSAYEKQPIVDVKGLDIFGNSPLCIKKNIDCKCPNCSRTLGAQKFAPHLEKCMGMGRISVRLAASKKLKNTVESEQEQEASDDNEEDWTYPEGMSRHKAASKRIKKEKTVTSSPHRTGRGPGRPPKHPKERGHHHHHHHGDNSTLSDFHSLKPSQQMHNVHTFRDLPVDYKITLLDQICGVVSERTGRLCTRSVNCPQHTEDQRQELRSVLLAPDSPDDMSSPPAKKTKNAQHKSSPMSDDIDVESGYSSHPLESSSSSKKKKSSKKGRRGHGITTATTVLHSSSMF